MITTININRFTLVDLPKKTHIITIHQDDPIPTVLEKIFQNRIMSAPVISNEGKLIGSIGIIDLVLFVMNICHTSQEMAKYFSLSDPKETEFVDFTDIKNYLVPGDNVQQTLGVDSASFITNYSQYNLLRVIPADTSFLELLKILCNNHRVAVGDDKLEDYITQSDVIRFFKEKNVFGDEGQLTVEALGLGSSNVVSVNQNQRVLEAFKKMIINKISGVAVVDDEGHFVGQISSSDIKCISSTGEMIARLYETYQPYRTLLVEKYNTPAQHITVTHATTLSQLLDYYVTNKFHRAFVLNHDKTIRAVISLTDIIKYVVSKNT